MSEPLWTPSPERADSTRMAAFHRLANASYGAAADTPEDLWRWSVTDKDAFWGAVWDFHGIIGHRGEPVLLDADRMPGARWFPDARLNFAENLLRRRDDRVAMIFRCEDRIRREVTWRELYDTTSRIAAALRAAGIRPGDRVAAYIPNVPEAMMYMLAAASIGATVSTASPDFGVQGVLDRFGQIEPRVLLAADGYFYNGKPHSRLERLSEILANLPTVETAVVLPYMGPAPALSEIPNAHVWEDFLSPHPAGDIDFEPLPFDHPLYILFSSGTTGAPKCIVQGAGGVLLQHVKEQQLHADVRADDRVFYFTTCGWMMWNWLATTLAAEATVVLYDGSPFYPDGDVIFDYADEIGMTLLGVSAKFLDASNKAGLRPRETHDLSSVRTLCSTGSVLVPEGFDYAYEHIKRDVHLASVSGGTDLCACFVGGNPVLPVYRGEIQAPALGMDVDVWDDDGRSIRGERGELVCKSAFPSVPLRFWGDDDGSRLKAAYFDMYPGVWRHGDWMEWTENGGAIIHGRSDATLNSGGVRIGTAEIYRQVERLPEIIESIVIGQLWENDTRIVLFVRLAEGCRLDEELKTRLRDVIRTDASPRHVPARILAVDDIPRTKSGKIVELAVRAVVQGEPVKNMEALANPEALELFRDRPELAE